MKPISVQLYSLREESARDFDAVLERLAAIGYRGVEPFNLYGKTPAAFKAQVEALGMTVSSSHTPWANRAPVNEVVNVLGALGLSRAAGGFASADFESLDAIKRTADTVNALSEALNRQRHGTAPTPRERPLLRSPAHGWPKARGWKRPSFPALPLAL